MAQPIFRAMKGVPIDISVCGYMSRDAEALNPYQTESIQRLSAAIQLEQQIYMYKHPEIKAMLELIISKLSHHGHTYEMVKKLAYNFVRPESELDGEIRKFLNLPPEGPYLPEDAEEFELNDFALYSDLQDIVIKHHPPFEIEISTPEVPTPFTPSSSFISNVTSVSTPKTPEPEPVREPTSSEIVFSLISHTLDKVTFSKITEDDIYYDTAYVELMKIVEIAMEIPVIEIRKDIANLLRSAYKSFEFTIIERQRLAAAVAWEKRMRKKLKKLLRRQMNFKGYETPISKSELSSHPSYKIPPPRPCKCHPQWKFNRYPKDRYGIYLTSGKIFDDNSITAAPVSSETHLEGVDNNTENEQSNVEVNNM